jgi:hypothetical protein
MLDSLCPNNNLLGFKGYFRQSASQVSLSGMHIRRILRDDASPGALRGESIRESFLSFGDDGSPAWNANILTYFVQAIDNN